MNGISISWGSEGYVIPRKETPLNYIRCWIVNEKKIFLHMNGDKLTYEILDIHTGASIQGPINTEGIHVNVALKFLGGSQPVISETGAVSFMRRPPARIQWVYKDKKVQLLQSNEDFIWQLYEKSTKTFSQIPFRTSFLQWDIFSRWFDCHKSDFLSMNDYLEKCSKKRLPQSCLELFKDCVIEKLEVEKVPQSLAHRLKAIYAKKIVEKSVLDSKVSIDCKRWAVTLINSGISDASNPSTWGGHAAIIIEGRKNETSFKYKAHIKRREGSEEAEVILQELKSNEKIRYTEKGETWSVNPYDVKKMLKVIEWEKNKQKKQAKEKNFRLAAEGLIGYCQHTLSKNKGMLLSFVCIQKLMRLFTDKLIEILEQNSFDTEIVNLYNLFKEDNINQKIKALHEEEYLERSALPESSKNANQYCNEIFEKINELLSLCSTQLAPIKKGKTFRKALKKIITIFINKKAQMQKDEETFKIVLAELIESCSLLLNGFQHSDKLDAEKIPPVLFHIGGSESKFLELKQGKKYASYEDLIKGTLGSPLSAQALYTCVTLQDKSGKEWIESNKQYLPIGEKFSSSQQMFIENQDGSWVEVRIPDNCMTWARGKLEKCGIYLDSAVRKIQKRTHQKVKVNRDSYLFPITPKAYMVRGLGSQAHFLSKDYREFLNRMSSVESKPMQLNPLIEAIKHTEVTEVLKLLNEQAVDPKQKNHKGYNALHAACKAGNIWAARLLLKRGMDVNDPSEDSIRSTPLILAAKARNKDLIRLLLENGANVNYQNPIGYTILHHLAESPQFVKNMTIIKILVKHSKNLNIENTRGETPISIALMNKKFQMARLFFEAGADINIGQYGEIIFRDAYINLDEDMIRLLIQFNFRIGEFFLSAHDFGPPLRNNDREGIIRLDKINKLLREHYAKQKACLVS